ncbi:hypothetical protein BofuT4_uP130350.1 [Botrytis cinerea T4]|uniref:Uncharacterized protein n=1 Tax=Botryotinia fuckeliana (strain T4) TaxID=999810 RepID=G2YRT7_BOTF4|nr:hypothetical protein BofuT4_uP130350.1 [Botrytis cinerea T4]
MADSLTSRDVLKLMTDRDLDWLKIYDDAMGEGWKSRAELLCAISDSLDEVMRLDPDEVGIVDLAMKERVEIPFGGGERGGEVVGGGGEIVE